MAAEIGLRIYNYNSAGVLDWLQYSPQTLVHLPIVERIEDSRLLWRLKPNLNTFYKGVPFQTNSWGFRDAEFAESEGQIVVLGRSVSMGEGVEASLVWPELLENKLKSEGRFPLKVHNLSVAGYSLSQAERNFELYGTKLKPKVVFLPVFLAEWNVAIATLTRPLPREIDNRLSLKKWLGGFYVAHAARQLHADLFRSILAPDWLALPYKNKIAEPLPSLALDLPRLVYSFYDQGAKVVLLILPSHQKLAYAYTDKIMSGLNDWARDLAFLKIIEVKDNESFTYKKIYYGDPHPDASTHAALAEVIFNDLMKSNFLE